MPSDRIDTGVWSPRARRRVWTCVVGMVMVTASVVGVLVSQGHSMIRDSAIEAIQRLPMFASARRTDGYWPDVDAWVWNDGGVFRCFVHSDAFQADADRVWKSLQSAQVTPWTVRADIHHGRSGVWGLTRVTDSAWIRVRDYSLPYPYAPSSDESQSARRALVDQFRSDTGTDLESRYPGIVSTGGWIRTRAILSGWVINAATIFGIAMFAWSAPGVVRDVRRHRRAMKLMRDSRCGWCGYDVRGLAEGTTACPECGKVLHAPPMPRSRSFRLAR